MLVLCRACDPPQAPIQQPSSSESINSDSSFTQPTETHGYTSLPATIDYRLAALRQEQLSEGYLVTYVLQLSHFMAPVSAETVRKHIAPTIEVEVHDI